MRYLALLAVLGLLGCSYDTEPEPAEAVVPMPSSSANWGTWVRSRDGQNPCAYTTKVLLQGVTTYLPVPCLPYYKYKGDPPPDIQSHEHPAARPEENTISFKPVQR